MMQTCHFKLSVRAKSIEHIYILPSSILYPKSPNQRNASISYPSSLRSPLPLHPLPRQPLRRHLQRPTRTHPSHHDHRNLALPPGSRVLEIGRGQGGYTLALAAAIGPDGHVDALDPAPPTYGAPITLGQSQARLKASPLGDCIVFHEVNPIITFRRTQALLMISSCAFKAYGTSALRRSKSSLPSLKPESSPAPCS